MEIRARNSVFQQIKFSWRLEGGASQYLIIDIPISIQTESK